MILWEHQEYYTFVWLRQLLEKTFNWKTSITKNPNSFWRHVNKPRYLSDLNPIYFMILRDAIQNSDDRLLTLLQWTTVYSIWNLPQSQYSNKELRLLWRLWVMRSRQQSNSLLFVWVNKDHTINNSDIYELPKSFTDEALILLSYNDIDEFDKAFKWYARATKKEFEKTIQKWIWGELIHYYFNKYII